MTSKPQRVAIYARVSTDETRQNPETQPNHLNEFDEYGVGYKDIRKDELSKYCPPLPVVRRF